MPAFPAFKTKPYYSELSNFLAASIDLATGELLDSAVRPVVVSELADNQTVVDAAAAAAPDAVAAELAATDFGPYVGPEVDAHIAADPAFSTAAETAVTTEIAGRDLVEREDVYETGIAASMTDTEGRRSWIEVTNAGRPSSHTLDILRDDLSITTDAYGGTIVTYTVTDEGGKRSWLEVAPNGGPTYHSLQLLEAAGVQMDTTEPEPETTVPAMETLLGSGYGLIVRTPDGGPRPYTSTPERVAFWGDSLIQGYPVPPFAGDGSDSIPGIFATLHTTGTILNGGYAGKTADEIAIWQGGLMVEVVPSGGTIPGSGTVAMTTTQAPRWRLGSPSGFSVHGTVAGVAGQLTRTSATTFDFARDAAGDPVTVADPVPFFSDEGAGFFDAITVIFAGRNDVSYFGSTSDLTDRVIAAAAATVASLTPLHPRVLLLGTLNSTGETAGTTGHTQVTTINNTLAARFPDSFFDVRRYLIDEAIYDAGITPTSGDLSAMGADTIPGSLMVDTVHFTPAAAAVVAQRLYDEMTTRGWL